MITAERIVCPNVERTCYLIYYCWKTNTSKCIGTLTEQENDAGETMYVYDIWQDKLTDDDRQNCVLSGIDWSLKEKQYVRSGGIPYFIDRCIPRKERSDYWEQLKRMQMDYFDPFEFLMRSRNLTNHCSCYVGRFATDFVDVGRAQHDGSYLRSLLPNLNEQPENVFHPIEGTV